MYAKKMQVFILLLIIRLPVAEAPAVATILGLVNGAIELASNIVRFINSRDDSEEQAEKIITELKEHTSKQLTELYNELSLDSFFDEIATEIKCIDIGTKQLHALLHSKLNERSFYRNEFIKHTQDAIKCAQMLSKTLTVNVPGDTNKGLELFAEKNRCNRTSLEVLQQFFNNKLAEGMVLDFTYKKLQQQSLSLDRERSFWKEEFNTVEDKFSGRIMECDKQFDKLLEQDMKNPDSAYNLQKSNGERYSNFWNDVVKSPSGISWYGDYNNTKLVRFGYTAIMVIFDKLDSVVFQTDRTKVLETIKENFFFPRLDIETCDRLGKHFCKYDFRVELCLTYDNDIDKKDTAFDEDSPSVRFTDGSRGIYLLMKDTNQEHVDGNCTFKELQLHTFSAAASMCSMPCVIIMLAISIIMRNLK